jgi:hypothetical protein
MKKTIISLLALIACISVNALTMKIYKGTTLVAEYPADQADNIVFSKDNGEQSATKKLVLEKYITESAEGNKSCTYYNTTPKEGEIVSVAKIENKKNNVINIFTYKDNTINSYSFLADEYHRYTLNNQNLVIKRRSLSEKMEQQTATTPLNTTVREGLLTEKTKRVNLLKLSLGTMMTT